MAQGVRLAAGEATAITVTEVMDKDPDGKLTIPTGIYQAAARFCDLSGKVSRIRMRGVTKGEARRKLNTDLAKRKRAAGSAGHAGHVMTLAQVATAWLKKVEVPQPIPGPDGSIPLKPKEALSFQTFVKYQRIVRDLSEAIGGIEVSSLTTGQCETYLHGLVDPVASTGYARAAFHHMILGMVVRYAINKGVRADDPLRYIDPILKKETNIVAPTALGVQQVRQALETYIKGPGNPNRRVQDVFELLVATGARLGEVLALRWEDVDFDAATVALSATIVAERGGTYRQPWAKRGSDRVAVLPGWTLEILRERFAERKETHTGAVFATSSGMFLTQKAFRKALNRALKFGLEGAALGPTNPHAFRKAVATLLAGGEGGAETAAGQLGHSSTKMTEKHYIQAAPKPPTDNTLALSAFAPR